LASCATFAATNVNQPRTLFQTYRLLAREPSYFVAITLRSSPPPESLSEGLRRTVTEIDADQPVQDIRSATHVIERGLANFKLVGIPLSGIRGFGVLPAAVGIYA
jgi:hypothetical protein